MKTTTRRRARRNIHPEFIAVCSHIYGPKTVDSSPERLEASDRGHAYFRERRLAEVQLPRITLPRTPVNKSRSDGLGMFFRSGGAPTRYPVQSAPHPPPRPPTTSFRAFSRLQHSPAGMQVEQVAGGMVTHPPSVLTFSHPPATSSSCRSESSSPWPSGETLGSTR
jgi:hypothetical protein